MFILVSILVENLRIDDLTTSFSFFLRNCVDLAKENSCFEPHSEHSILTSFTAKNQRLKF